MHLYDLAKIFMDIVSALHVHDASFNVEQRPDELPRSLIGGLKNFLRSLFSGFGRRHKQRMLTGDKVIVFAERSEYFESAEAVKRGLAKFRDAL